MNVMQWYWESCLTGLDKEREIARRRGLFQLAIQRDWAVCRWCMEEVPLSEFSTNRMCGHQYHNVSCNDISTMRWWDVNQEIN